MSAAGASNSDAGASNHATLLALNVSTVGDDNRAWSSAATIPASTASSDGRSGPPSRQNAANAADDAAAKGLLLYGASTLCVAGVSSLAKLAGQRGVPFMQCLLARSCMVGVLNLPRLLRTANPLGTRRWLLLARGLVGFGAGAALFGAVQYLPLSDAMTLGLLSPVFVALLAPATIGERPSCVVLALLPLFLVAVVLLARPTFVFGASVAQLSAAGVALGLLQALLSGSVRLFVRHLRTTEPPPVIINWVSVTCVVCSAAACVVTPGGLEVPRSLGQWWPMLGTGLCGYGNQVCFTLALRHVKASAATALTYLQLVWALLIGAIAFNELPGAMEMVGTALIVACTALLAWRESRQQPKEDTGDWRRAAPHNRGSGRQHRDLSDSDDEDDERAGLLPGTGSLAPRARAPNGGSKAAQQYSLQPDLPSGHV